MELLAAVKVTGADPAADKRERRDAATVAELCDIYLADAEGGRLLTRRGQSKKPSTLMTDRSRIGAHIKPLIGAIKVPALTRLDVENLRTAIIEGRAARRQSTRQTRGLSNVRGGTGAAARCLGLLGAMLEYAVQKRLAAR